MSVLLDAIGINGFCLLIYKHPFAIMKKNKRGGKDMNREEMIEYIQEKLKCATDKEVEMVYGLLLGLLGRK